MTNNFSSEDGNTLVELVMVMVLMVFFGFTIFTLTQTGSHTEQKIIDNKNAQVDARIAMSYINVKIRKNDSTGKINVAVVDETGENGIVIKNRTFEGDFDRWIYFSNGILRECIVDVDQQPDDNLSTEIVAANEFAVLYDEQTNTITYAFEYNYNDEKQEISSSIKLRNTRPEGTILL